MTEFFEKKNKRALRKILKEQRNSVKDLKELIERSEMLVESGPLDLQIGEAIEDLANALLDIGDLIAEAHCKALAHGHTGFPGSEPISALSAQGQRR